MSQPTALLCLTLPILSANALGDINTMRPIGTGQSQGSITAQEQVLFEYEGSAGVMTHFWTAGSPQVDNVTWRYYIDNETVPSIEFQPFLACGAGFDDQTAPWGTKWFGKGAKSTGWFNNFRIPYGSSVRVTFALDGAGAGTHGMIWSIVRGLEGMPLEIGGLSLPSSARLKLQKTDVMLKPLEFVDIVGKDTGAGTAGLFFAVTMQVESSENLNFMEGCFHWYDDQRTQWPGMIMSTGMEDYFDSAFYFNGGTFHSPVSGNTHIDGQKWSGYRFHDMDLMPFSNGMRFQWRNGDVTDTNTGLKCTLETGGKPAGNPQPSHLIAYAWVYMW